MGKHDIDCFSYYLDKIITSIESLDKWNGFLYDWYNVRNFDKMFPFDISSVDNGNLAASYLTAKAFCNEIGLTKLEDRIGKLYNDMDFSKLYTDMDVFSVAYDTQEDRLVPFNYNKFASESRILSFIA